MLRHTMTHASENFTKNLTPFSGASFWHRFFVP